MGRLGGRLCAPQKGPSLHAGTQGSAAQGEQRRHLERVSLVCRTAAAAAPIRSQQALRRTHAAMQRAEGRPPGRRHLRAPRGNNNNTKIKSSFTRAPSRPHLEGVIFMSHQDLVAVLGSLRGRDQRGQLCCKGWVHRRRESACAHVPTAAAAVAPETKAIPWQQ